MSESFENGTKGAYANGNVNLDSGSWAFHNALLADLATDHKIGSQAVRIRATAILSMIVDVNGANSIKLHAASFNNDTAFPGSCKNQRMARAIWTDVTAAATATATLTAHTIAVNEPSPVRFRIQVTGPSGQRLTVDDFEILN